MKNQCVSQGPSTLTIKEAFGGNKRLVLSHPNGEYSHGMLAFHFVLTVVSHKRWRERFINGAKKRFRRSKLWSYSKRR